MCYFKKLMTSKAFKRRKRVVLMKICIVFDCFFGSIILCRFLILSSIITMHGICIFHASRAPIHIQSIRKLKILFNLHICVRYLSIMSKGWPGIIELAPSSQTRYLHAIPETKGFTDIAGGCGLYLCKL